MIRHSSCAAGKALQASIQESFKEDKYMNQYEAVTQELCRFIAASPTCFHVIRNAADMLRENGFLPLSEHDRWDLKPGQAYYVSRSGSSLIAFVLPDGAPSGFQIIAKRPIILKLVSQCVGIQLPVPCLWAPGLP